MTIKPFAIQSADLTLGGVNLQAGTTGVVIPGVTQAVNYVPEEVEDTDDQTHSFNSVPVVIDHTFYSILNGDYIPSNGGGYVEAEYEVTELDDDDFIEDIEIVSQGAGWNLSSANGAKNNNMWAYVGSAENPFASFVGTDWIQIPFRVKIRAGEIETIGGGGSVDGLQGNTSYEPEGEGDVRYSLSINEDITLTVYQGGSGQSNLGPAISLGNTDASHRSGVVAIGNDDVGYNSAPGGVYIGAKAGWFADEEQPGPQGENAIAIGTRAAYMFAQDNSITLNATGENLNPDQSGLFIKPIREEAYDDATLYYNPTSGEITYASTSASNGLAPQLVKNNGNLQVNADLEMDDIDNGLITVVDSDGNNDQWFNAVATDENGVVYSGGTNDDGYQYVWAVNPDGTVKWKVGIDQVDGRDVYPRTMKYDNDGSLIIGVTYESIDTNDWELGVIALNTSDGSVITSYFIETSTEGNKYIRDLDIDGNDNHILVGDFYGESVFDNNISPVMTSWGSNVNILTVQNSDLTNPVLPWSYNIQIQNDPLDANAWYNPSYVNYFRNLPVTTVTGFGGPQYYEGGNTNYADGQLQLVVGGTGTTWKLRLDATWADGTAQTHLLDQTGTYTFTITPGDYTVTQLTNWTDVGGGFFEASVSVEGSLVDGTTNVNSITINKNRLTVTLRYVPMGANNSGLTDGQIDVYDVEMQGQGYADGNIVKVLGSQMGGVDTITVTGTAHVSTSVNNLFFAADDYPGFSAVQNGWRASGPGITGWATLSNVQLAGALWRFDVPEGVTVQAGEVYTIDNNGNDIVMSLIDAPWYGPGSVYLGPATGKVSPTVAATTRFEMNQGIDYRGVENTTTYSAGTDYTSGQVSFAGSGPWTIGVADTLTDIKSLMIVGKSITITGNSTTISVTILGEGYPDGEGGTTYEVSDASGLGTNSVFLDSIELPDGTFPATTWNLRSSLNSQAFIWTPNWHHTYGDGNYEGFSSVAYDSFDNSIYTNGYYWNSENTHEIVLVKLNAETGATIWSKYVEDSTGGGGDAGSVAVDGTGNVYMSGRNDDGDTIVTKLTSEGVLVWQVIQMNSDEWNYYPQMVLDSNGDIIVAGSFYNNNDPENNHNVWSFMKLSKTDGSLIWARYLDNAEKYDMYDMYDNNSDVISVQGDNICYAGYVYDANENYYVAVSARFNTNGLGLGTYGRWIYSEDTNAAWVDNTPEAVVVSATVTASDQAEFTVPSGNFSITADNVGSVVDSGFQIGGAAKVVFADGSELNTAGIARHSKDEGGTTRTLSADMNGKFLYFDNSNNTSNTFLFIPANADVELPIGFTVTVVVGNMNGYSIYVNNEDNGDVVIYHAGSSDGVNNNWTFANDGNPGIYTIMKVDTNTWMLAGPNVNVD